MTDLNDSAAIEATLERDRASLSSTLDALQDRLSLDRLADDALASLRSNAAGFVRAFDRQVRANPLALALVAGGLAWLAIGRGRPKDAPAAKAPSIARWEDEGGAVALPAHTQHASEEAEWLRMIDSRRDRLRKQLDEIESGAALALGQARDGVADLAGGMKDGFLHGLEDLGDQARDRIVAARKKAYAAYLQRSETLKAGVRAPGSLIESHPFLAGGIALAAGAGLAAALPPTDAEDRLFGSESDRLMQEAGRLLAQERDRAAQVAAAAAQEVKEAARQALGAQAQRAPQGNGAEPAGAMSAGGGPA